MLSYLNQIEVNLNDFYDFVEGAGALICLENWIEPIKYKITVGHSTCRINISKDFVTIIGDSLNMTARIRDLSTERKTPILDDSANGIGFVEYELSEPFNVIKKKDYLRVRYLSKKVA